MASRILCPQCETAFAYSPALLGKTVKCRQCQHTFVVSSPPADAPPAPTEAPALAKIIVPPPLPAKVVTSRDVRRRTKQREADDRRTADDRPRPRRRDDDDEEAPPVRRRSEKAAPRSSGTGVLIGLIAVCVLGVIGIGAGIAWAVWPSPSKSTTAMQAAATPYTPPVAVEPAKNLDDILKDAPRRVERPDPQPPIRIEPPPFERRPNPPPVIRPDRPPVRGGPGLPGGVVGKPPEPRSLPSFVPVTTLPIKPPGLSKSIEERRLPGPAEFGVLAGGGKLVILYLPRQSTIAVFDVTTAKVSLPQINVTDPKTMIVGGMNHFLVYQPGTGSVDRYNTQTLEKEGSGKLPGTVMALGMGASSNGPLVAAMGGDRRTFHGGATIAFFDPVTLKELPVEIDGDKNAFGLGIHDQPVAIRVSGDGSVVTGWGTKHNPGTECVTFDGGRATRHYKDPPHAALFPAADGQVLFSRGGMYTPEGQPIGDAKRHAGWDDPSYVPAAHGEFALVLTPQRGGIDRRPPKADVVLGREKKSVHWLGDLHEAEVTQFGEPKDMYDQQFFLVPDAHMLVAIDAKDKARLMLHKVDVDEGLAKLDVEYLHVSSRPPGAVNVGETYKYVPVVKAKKAGWKVTVESGPKGMTVGSDGLVSWAVPKDFGEAEVTVILKFAAGSKEVFQTVRVAVKKGK